MDQSNYEPTEEDLRKRRERAKKRRLKTKNNNKSDEVNAVSPSSNSSGSKKNKHKGKKGTSSINSVSDKDAGRITKSGIVGLSREMTEADSQGKGWSKVGSNKRKKSKNSIKAISSTSADPNKRILLVPTGKLGIIIGGGGLTLRKIEAETGCSIQLPQAREDAPTTKTSRVVITGDDEDMLRETAKCISDLVHRGHSDLIYRGTGAKQSTFKLDTSKKHILIGKGGATIRALEAKSKCKIIPSSDRTSSKVSIIGEPSGVAIALEALKQIDRFCYSSIADPSLTHEEVEVSSHELGYIIGHRGQVIKSIQGDTNTKIHTPGPGRKNKNVIVVGTAKAVNRAVAQIRRTIERNTY
jgi:rRNA processing protein Krr1/Pno1